MMWIWRWRRRLRRWFLTIEVQTCPQRVEVGSSHHKGGDLDTWNRDTWALERQWSDWLLYTRSRMYDRLGWTGNRFYRGTFWPAGFAPPRTCSFCGSVHPDDAIALMRRGWEVESSGKNYKRYLHPPGYRPLMAVRSPVPPVKLYVQHMSAKQIHRLNDALDALDAQHEKV